MKMRQHRVVQLNSPEQESRLCWGWPAIGARQSGKLRSGVRVASMNGRQDREAQLKLVEAVPDIGLSPIILCEPCWERGQWPPTSAGRATNLEIEDKLRASEEGPHCSRCALMSSQMSTSRDPSSSLRVQFGGVDKALG